MIYKLFVTEDGVPKTGLTPTWNCLADLDGVDKSGSAPAITEISAANAPGWYKCEFVFGTAGLFDQNTPELVGVIDAGTSLSNYERYVPVTISLRDLALTKLVNKASYDMVSGVEAIRNDSDSADELKLTLSQTGDVEYRTPSG